VIGNGDITNAGCSEKTRGDTHRWSDDWSRAMSSPWIFEDQTRARDRRNLPPPDLENAGR
jgi:hypothetical protein